MQGDGHLGSRASVTADPVEADTPNQRSFARAQVRPGPAAVHVLFVVSQVLSAPFEPGRRCVGIRLAFSHPDTALAQQQRVQAARPGPRDMCLNLEC